MLTTINIHIIKAKNIGPTIAKRLNEIGIYSLADLHEVTPVRAYEKMDLKHPDKNLPICYYPYSLQGALLDLHWDNIPENLKIELRKQVKK